MCVYVLNKYNKPLMPCQPVIARLLLKQGTGFIKGKRSTGYFALETINGEKVHASANIKKHTVRVTARTTTLKQLMESDIPPCAKAQGLLAEQR